MNMDSSEARNSPQPGQSEGEDTQSQGVGDTFTGLVEDVQNIVRDEVQLAKTELKDDATQMGKAAGMLAGGGIFGYTGFVFLMLGLTHLISRKLPMWLSASIVGTALATVAGILSMSGKGQLQSSRLKPEQTLESIREDKEWASREMSSVADGARSVTK